MHLPEYMNKMRSLNIRNKIRDKLNEDKKPVEGGVVCVICFKRHAGTLVRVGPKGEGLYAHQFCAQQEANKRGK